MIAINSPQRVSYSDVGKQYDNCSYIPPHVYICSSYVHYVSLCSYLPPLTSAKPAYGSSVLNDLEHIRRPVASYDDDRDEDGHAHY